MREIIKELEANMSMKGNVSCKTFDARGNGDGEICCTITGNHQSFISDYTAIVLENHPQDSRVKINEDGINQPLSANMCHDPSNGGLVLVLENHPADSRVKIQENNVFQTLSSRMGTGGG